VYVICTLSAVLCIPEGEAALRVQNTFALECHGTADLYHSAPLIVNTVLKVLKRSPLWPWSSDIL